MERLPGYLNLLRKKSGEAFERISSATIAEEMNLSAITVRKDLAYFASGRPRVGYDREELIERINTLLTANDCNQAVLVGAGNLGRALLSYGGFEKYSLRILAGFDVDKGLIGTEVHGKPVLHINHLRSYVQRTGAQLGIITVPAAHAQEVCDLMVAAGITGILCCAPAHLSVPQNVVVRYEDFAVSLAMLSLSVSKD